MEAGPTMMRRILRHFEHTPKPLLLIFGVALVFFIGGIDLISGREVDFAFFYLLPIALSSWYVGGEAGIWISILSTLIWFVTDRVDARPYASALALCWNSVMRAGIFIVEAVTLSQLRSKLDRLSEMATRDYLTGLPNDRAFLEFAAREMERSLGVDPLTLVYIDVGGFEWINHRFGYTAGDHMLCTIAQVIKENIPRPDLIGRVGGTTFAVLLPKTNSDTASLILKKVQENLRAERRKYSQPIIFSISAMACGRAPRKVAELMQEAELRMRRTKGSNHDNLEIVHVDSVSTLH